MSAHMLGIEDQYIPATWDDAESQARQLLDPILAPTPEGIRLADILLDLGLYLDLTLLSRPVLGALIRFTLGDQIADWLGIPPEPAWGSLLAFSWSTFIAVREGILGAGMPQDVYWTLDEFLRQSCCCTCRSCRCRSTSRFRR